MLCADSRIRIWRFATGKLRRSFDESLEAAQQLQKSGAVQFVLEDMDFGRRYALEKEIRAAGGLTFSQTCSRGSSVGDGIGSRTGGSCVSGSCSGSDGCSGR